METTTQQDSSTEQQETTAAVPWHVHLEAMIEEKLRPVTEDMEQTIERAVERAVEDAGELISASDIADELFDGWEGARRWDRMVRSIAEDVTVDEIVEALGFDAEEVAGNLCTEEIAGHLDYDRIAEALDLDSISERVDVDYDEVAERAAGGISERDIAACLDVSEIAGFLDAEEIADALDLGKGAEVENLRREVESLRESLRVTDGALAYLFGLLSEFAVPFARAFGEAQDRMAAATAEPQTTTETTDGGYL